MQNPNSEILIYQNPNGNIKIDVRLEEKATIKDFLIVQKECELEENSVCRNFRHTANE